MEMSVVIPEAELPKQRHQSQSPGGSALRTMSVPVTVSADITHPVSQFVMVFHARGLLLGSRSCPPIGSTIAHMSGCHPIRTTLIPDSGNSEMVAKDRSLSI